MNIVLDINSIEIKNVSFLDSKKNIIINGKFTRLMYSNPFLTMNGIYINIPINLQYTNAINNDTNIFNVSRTYNLVDDLSNELQSLKNIVFFNANNHNNMIIIKQICELEYKLLSNYKLEFLSSHGDNNKTFSMILNRQLSIGKIKLYRELNPNQSYGLPEEKYKVSNISNVTLEKNEETTRFNLGPPPGFQNINYLGTFQSLQKNILEEKKMINFNSQISNKNIQNSKEKSYIVLKISGIWETKDEIGLTYKFLEMFSI